MLGNTFSKWNLIKQDLPKYNPVLVLSCFSRPVEIVIIFVPLSIVKALNLSSLKNTKHCILLGIDLIIYGINILKLIIV